MNEWTKPSPGDITVGYVVELWDPRGIPLARGRIGIVVPVAGDGLWIRWRSCDEPCRLEDLELSRVVRIYGWPSLEGLSSWGSPLSLCNRPLLWESRPSKKPTIKMTMGEICKKLGYDVEIVKEENE